jgi:hydrogenase nickel incorporation protein HypA/HybF
MHEVGLMQTAVEMSLAEAARRGANRIHCVTLRIGPLAGVETGALALAFEIAAGGTPAAGARLEVETAPVVCFCNACQVEFRPAGWIFECPLCSAVSGAIRQGHELELASLEVS